MTDLELYKHTDDWVAMVEPVVDLSNKLAQTPFAGAMRGKPADVFGCILYGRELGLSPLQSLQLINVIQGRPTLGSEGLRALYLGAGHRIWPVEWDERKCTVRAERGDGRGSVDITYTIKDATDAGLLKNAVWRTFPKQMLLARATSMAIKAIAPDVALGLEAADMPAEAQERPSQPVSTIQVSTAPPLAPSQQGDGDGSGPGDPGKGNLLVVGPDPSTPGPDVPGAEPVGGPDLVTAAQLRLIGRLIGQLEVRDGHKMDRQERRAFIAAVLGTDHLESAKDLTVAQAHQVIDRLQSLVDDQPQAER
jgi:hypothetical protein